jgi:hypothetical protein
MPGQHMGRAYLVEKYTMNPASQSISPKLEESKLALLSFSNILSNSFNKIIPICLSVSLFLILLMSLISGYNEHPDEHLHYTATQYYYNHWLPPRVGDQDTINSYSKYGASYLNSIEIVYFLSGKFSSIFHLFSNNYRVDRFFNLFLFLILLCYCLSINISRNYFLILLISPQLWYIFSYLNGDAFPFFISFIIVSELVIKDSLSNKWIDSKNIFQIKLATIWLAVLISLLILSKPNYYIMVLYIFFLFIWKITDYPLMEKKKFIRIYFLIFSIVFLIIFSRYLCDIIFNGFDKNDKTIYFAEKFAEAKFRPSLHPKESFFTLRLRDKGVHYIELFTFHKWHEKSFKSLFGTYGWMNIFSPFLYYILMAIFYITFIMFIIFSIFYKSSLKNIFFLIITIGFIFSTIIISTLYSWVYDLQAQGRYLLPILIMLLPIIYMNDNILNKKILAFMVLILFLLSSYSFISVGLLKIPKELRIRICSAPPLYEKLNST